MYFIDASFRSSSSQAPYPRRRIRRRLPDIFNRPAAESWVRVGKATEAPMSLPSARLRLLGRTTHTGVLTSDRTVKAMRKQVLSRELEAKAAGVERKADRATQAGRRVPTAVATYRHLGSIGMQPAEAGNLTAYLDGLTPVEAAGRSRWPSTPCSSDIWQLLGPPSVLMVDRGWECEVA